MTDPRVTELAAMQAELADAEQAMRNALSMRERTDAAQHAATIRRSIRRHEQASS